MDNLKQDLESKSPGITAVMLMAVLILLLTTGGSFWMYYQGSQAMRSQSQGQGAVTFQRAKTEEAVSHLFKQMDEWAKNMSLATAVGAIGLVLVGAMAFSLWRKQWLKRAGVAMRRSKELAVELEELEEVLKRDQMEKWKVEERLRNTEAEIEKRVEDRSSRLARTCAALEEELNSRRQAERNLTNQAKELERSKDVLEMHVQVRTEELQKLKSRYELILNSAGEGIYGLDLQGRTTFVNPPAAKLTGWPVEEMVGKPEHEIFYGLKEQSGADAEGIKKDQDGNHLADQIFRRRDGLAFPVEYVRTPITENGKLFGAVVIFKDITERKRADDALARKAAELSRSNAELEQFAYVASHDLQEPLRKIQAFGDRLKTKCDAANLKDGRDFLERMLSAAARMQTLINDLLTFSRVISNSQPFVDTDLGKIAKEVLGDLEVRIEQTKAKVELGNLPTIQADPTQMRQLLQNLIGNALKFQRPGVLPVVKIEAEIRKVPYTGGDGKPEDETCLLVVRDNGIGFEEQYAEKIFAVFQRLHGRSEYEGTGVGLAVCRRITDRHSGTITAQGTPNEGALFTIMLPVRQPLQEATE